MANPTPAHTILIVDDEPSICWIFRQLIEAEGWRALIAASAEEGLEIAASAKPDLVILDVRLPGISGLDALPKLRELSPETPVLVMTAHGTMDTAIEAMRRGAFNYLAKPIHNEDALHQIRTALERRSLSREVAQLRRDLRAASGSEEPLKMMAGQSPPMQEVYKKIGAVAAADSAVLILGESGTGKELAARAIHAYSQRSRGPFVAVNCAALPEQLLESELYGHVKGAFTGAIRDKEGKAEQARGGTLFLDEIGEMPHAIQAKLLRFLDDKKIERVGGNEPLEADVRIIAATNLDLRARIRSNQFREDLYYRLNVVSIELPPLRARKEDIPLLVAHFLTKAEASAAASAGIGKDVMELFTQYNWPGNVRELRNAVEHAAILARGGVISPEHIPQHILASLRGDDATQANSLEALIRERTLAALTKVEAAGEGNVYNELLAAIEKPLIQTTLQRVAGNQVKASALLGIHRTTLRKKIEEYGL